MGRIILKEIVRIPTAMPTNLIAVLPWAPVPQ